MVNKTENPKTKPWRPWWNDGVLPVWDKRLLIPSLIVGLAAYAWCSYQIKIHTPPEGYVYEQLEPLTGVYKCCGDGGRSSKSWVDDVPTRCITPAYYGGQRYTDCGFKNELNGKVVTVKRVWYDTNFGRANLVRELKSEERLYFYNTDQKIREMWLLGSENEAQSNALGAFLIAYLILYFIFSRKLKNTGDKK